MAKKDYIPDALGTLALWLSNYKAKLTEHAATLGLNAAFVGGQIALVDALQAKLVNNTQKQQDAQQARAELNEEKLTSIKGIRTGAQQIKKNDAYTNSLGEDLGIVGDENSIDIENAKPELKAKKVENGWRLSFNLHGFFDSVKIYRTRPGEARQFIAIDTSSPYIDTNEQINGTQYLAYYMLGDDSVGLESDLVTIEV
jgi:hypothetical protein